MNRVAELSKNDLLKAVYFILCKFKLDDLHLQGTSYKSDLIGGYIDRWINRIYEYAIFNKLLENKGYKVVADYFLYANDSEKNAPDILGLVDENNEPLAIFSRYVNGTWISEEGMPYIEVKAYRKNQKFVSVKESQMHDDHYYAFVETDILGDYLSILFEDKLFDDQIFNSLIMNPLFIKNDIGK